MDPFGTLACGNGQVWQGSGIMLMGRIDRDNNVIVGYFRDQVGTEVFKLCEQRGPYASTTTLVRRHNRGSARKLRYTLKQDHNFVLKLIIEEAQLLKQEMYF